MMKPNSCFWTFWKREPNNKRARKELSELRDPVRNNPALTPAHVKDVEEVQRLLELGWGYYDLGKFDEALKTFSQVLKIDPYNTAARNGQEAVHKRRMNYYGKARNAVRADMLARRRHLGNLQQRGPARH